MWAATHIAMGLYLFLMFERLATIENRLVLFLIIIAGAILPDIDIATSTFGKRIKIVGEVFKHRGFIHTIFALIIFSLLVHTIWHNNIYTLGFALAFLFHLILDSFTKAGIKPFWFGWKLKGFTKTGSVVDKFIFVFLVIVSVLIVFDII